MPDRPDRVRGPRRRAGDWSHTNVNDSANLVRNADFAQGHNAPAHWRWERLAGRGEPPVQRGDGNGCSAGLTLRLPAAAAGQWVQTIRCRGETLYRVEVHASYAAPGASHGDGLAVRIRALRKGEVIAGSEVACAPWRSTTPRVWRTVYRTPHGATKLELAVRASGRRGEARILRVRAIPMDFLFVEGHPLACPPPPHACPRPIAASAATIVRAGEHDEPLRALLGAMLGPRRVRVVSPREIARGPRSGEALFMASAQALPRGTTWATLCRSAERSIIVLSLDAFAALVNRRRPGTVSLREWRQTDDTIAAKVHHAGFVTNGFALEDTFHFHLLDEETGAFSQRQLARTAGLRQFLSAESIQVTLVSETNTDSTSDRPLALFKPIGQGGIFVIDAAPILADPTSEAESTAAAVLLGNLLGLDVAGFGQYADPQLGAPAWHRHLSAAANQFSGIATDWVDPSGTHRPFAFAGATPLVEAGPRDALLDRSHLPLVVLRSGLDCTGRFGLAGAWTWLKNLVRMEPHACRYAPRLLALCRPILIPHGSVFPVDALTGLLAGTSASLVIDIHPSPRNALRLRLPDGADSRGNGARRNGCGANGYNELGAGRGRTGIDDDWLGRLGLLAEVDRQLRLDVGFGRLPAASAEMADLDAWDWRYDEAPLVMERALASGPAGGVSLPIVGTGAVHVRLEVPCAGEPAAGTSIVDTHRLATLLELIVGLRFGLIAVNRRCRPRQLTLTAVPPLREAELIAADGRSRAMDGTQLGRELRAGLVLEPGMTLVALH